MGVWIGLILGKVNSPQDLVSRLRFIRTIFIVPEESDQFRVSLAGKFVIWRSQDRGESWEPLTNGLPDQAYLVSLREAMAVDPCDEAGIYVGTSSGQIFFSVDKGDSWSILADFLPPVYSIETAVLD